MHEVLPRPAFPQPASPMTLPFHPPLKPMLAKLERGIPRGSGWRYEPKWDGFRAIVFRDGDEAELSSRDSKPLNRYFPEIAELLVERLPPGSVVDGEIVLDTPMGLNFDMLLQRIHPAASRVRMLAKEVPASFVAFDLLAEGGEDLTRVPLAERRRRLEEILDGAGDELTGGGPVALLTPHTDDPDVAERWFTELEADGLDGVMAKRDDLHYLPGERAMIKVKHERTADCVVGGYRLGKDGASVGSLLLALYDDDGTLHYVGFTSSFKAAERREMVEVLRPLEGESAFGHGRTPGGPSRWSQGRDMSYVALRPELVCEVAFDHMQGDRFRHGSTFRRWRPDKPPQECTFDQVERPRRSAPRGG